MNPTASLIGNLLYFARHLRRAGIKVTTGMLIDVVKGIQWIDIARKEDFRSLLRANLVSRREDFQIFDELFDCFWCLGKWLQPQGFEQNRQFPDETITVNDLVQKGECGLEWTDTAESANDSALTLAWSPEERLAKKDFGLLNEDEIDQVSRLIRDLAKRMRIRLSRRWKRKLRGDRIDFRRSIRRSLICGGEIVELTYKQRKPKKARIVMICDVSGSMDIYSRFLILFMYALQNELPSVETFVFATRLTRVSHVLGGLETGEALDRLSAQVWDWSGGTNIGGCLGDYNQSHDIHLPQTITFVLSDGWDRGDPSILEREIKRLKRNTQKLIWLNPLAATPGYRPICRGMAAVLPYLDCFLPCNNVQSLETVAKILGSVP